MGTALFSMVLHGLLQEWFYILLLRKSDLSNHSEKWHYVSINNPNLKHRVLAKSMNTDIELLNVLDVCICFACSQGTTMAIVIKR
jgi:hypothetical protein